MGCNVKARLDTRYLKTVTADENKITRHWDTEIPGYLLQVSKAGTMTFYYRYQLDGVRHTYKIGRYPRLTATQARSLVTIKAGDVEQGLNVQQEKKGAKRRAVNAKKTTLKSYMDDEYRSYMESSKKTGAKIIKNIETHFSQWNKKQLIDINQVLVGNWRTAQLKKGRTKGGVNRPISYLRALLNHAYNTDIIASHPLAKFKQLKEDKNKVIRYLSESEGKRLHEAMTARDAVARLKRESSNQWRKDRLYKLKPLLPKNGYSDHLTPIVILCLNTGIRRGELFDLEWKDIDFKAKTLIIKGGVTTSDGAKSGHTRVLPLNGDALGLLIKWRNQATSKKLVFPGKRGRLNDIRTSFKNLLKAADIKDFRFHDLRHDFASQLVMKGAALNTVRELMGHSDIQMTLRYAHLSPNIKSEAVELLSGGPVSKI